MRFNNNLRSSISVSAVLAVLASPVSAEEVEAEQSPVLDAITVTASREDTLDIGGSVQRLEIEDLETFSYSDVNRILRQMPGVFLQEEDGFGLRPNIGIRGSGTDRSARVTIMEDGILKAPAPYAAPSVYYFPRMARIHAVELAKGPAAIKYGPRPWAGHSISLQHQFLMLLQEMSLPGSPRLRATIMASACMAGSGAGIRWPMGLKSAQ
jgi:Fe(3+) dicitrate transport protein